MDSNIFNSNMIYSDAASKYCSGCGKMNCLTEKEPDDLIQLTEFTTKILKEQRNEGNVGRLKKVDQFRYYPM